MSEPRTTEILENAKSIFGSIETIDIAEEKVFQSKTFSIAKRHTLTASSTNDIVIDTTGCSCDYLVFQPVAFKAYGAGPVNIDMYFGVDADEDGTLWGSVNRDNVSAETSPVDIRLNPTINDVGTKLPVEFVIFSNGTAAVAVAGGESREGLIFVARQDGKYMFRVINTEANPAFFHVSATWYEVNV